MPKSITHQRKLVEGEDAFDPRLATSFFTTLRDRHAGLIVCEPRHVSWFAEDAEGLLKTSGIGRVAADPAVVPAAAEPGGRPELSYYSHQTSRLRPRGSHRGGLVHIR